jgi:hypothetical protein
LTAFFGYVSANNTSVSVPVGPSKFLSPEGLAPVQPTQFSPGVSSMAWNISIDLGEVSSITWTLLGQNVTATNDPSLYCSASVCPPGPYGLQGITGDTGPTGPSGAFPIVRVVTASSTNSTAVATCKIGETVIGGSGSCANAGGGHLAASLPSGITWKATCETGTATAIAYCASDPAAKPVSFPH